MVSGDVTALHIIPVKHLLLWWPLYSNIKTLDIIPMLVECWASVVDGGPAFTQHWINVFSVEDAVLHAQFDQPAGKQMSIDCGSGGRGFERKKQFFLVIRVHKGVNALIDIATLLSEGVCWRFSQSNAVSMLSQRWLFWHGIEKAVDQR